MRPRDVALALVVVAIWGVNFAVIKIGLQHVTPLALAVSRFVLAAVPWVFFIRRPQAPLGLVLAFSLLMFALQFGFLFTGMKIGMSAGLASLILQLQVFFTIGLAVPFLGERPQARQVIGAALAFAGIAVVALHVGGDVNLPGLLLAILAAAAWGGGNIVSRRISMANPGTNILALVVWGSLFALPPLLAVALALDAQGFVRSFTQLDAVSLGAIAYIGYLSTLFGFFVWSRLLGLYPVAMVAPFTLLVPVFGFLGAAIILSEPIEGWKLAASALVIAGLCVNLFGPRGRSMTSR